MNRIRQRSSSSSYDVYQFGPPVQAGHNVQIDQLIGTLLIVSAGIFLRIAYDPKALKMHAFDQIFTLDV